MTKSLFLVALGVLLAFLFSPFPAVAQQTHTDIQLWEIQCIDTMKTSRDRAKEWRTLSQANAFIENQIQIIKKSGGNCVAISTPYDSEFLPMLSKWVEYARQYELRVWFRGNFSGWEGWFGYPLFYNPQEHHQKTYDFIVANRELFHEGDIFTPVPEPENGVIGDPRATGKATEFNSFLIKSFDTCKKAFTEIKISVACGYFSMNGDVAKEILTKDTVKKTGNIVVIDHYVKTPEQMRKDIIYLAKKYDAPIVLGEYGAPIPDINGEMGESEQAAFIQDMLQLFYQEKQYIHGINYWTLYDGTTALLRDDYTEKEVVRRIENFYKPAQLRGRITNTVGDTIADVLIKTKNSIVAKTDDRGVFHFVFPAGSVEGVVEHTAYIPVSFTVKGEQRDIYEKDIVLTPRHPDLWYKIRLVIRKLFIRNS